MDAVFDFKQERGLKGFVITLLTTFAVFVISLATFAVAVLSESSSAENRTSHVVVVSSQGCTVSNTHNIDTAGLVLFGDSNLKGALK